MIQTVLKINGMTCGHCAAHVSRSLSKVSGVAEVQVDLANRQAVVRHENADLEAMKAAVDEAGYEFVGVA